ncbi:hypothetical protein [Paenarthrobacter nitroguajacolicus]|uniref:hypothetical protein n=1 Tax=Paenarthrobacter nitroguajacolicus TaxID=211146 RepID=UPI000B1CCD75|nr:hypothetical protein [Paenarthrobacter nitroguajacolicus]
MIQDGLHVGLAAWITAQRGAGGFVACPAIPFSTELTTFENALTMTNLKRVAEFARMVNFCPHKGQFAEPFSQSGPLWEVHRKLLESMEFALRPWTEAEDEAWKRAKEVLYETGDSGTESVSRLFRLYDEYRIAYSELATAGADPSALTGVLSDWLAIGKKMEVESALSTLNRLALRSSLPEAQAAALALSPSLLPVTDDDSYAPTTFSPVSAVNTDTWLTAEATLDELNRAVGDLQPRSKWDAWKGTRSGVVRFRFAALEIRRPWFQSTMYEADDWRLPNGAAASVGDGVEGVLPAYVSALYLAVVDDIRLASTPPPLRLPELARPPRLQLDLVGPRALTAAAGTRPALLPKSLPIAMRAADVSVIRAEGTMHLPAFRGRLAHFGKIELLTQERVFRRVEIANAIAGSASTATEAPKPPVYVVGFGCQPVPAAPRPNPNYTWPTP